MPNHKSKYEQNRRDKHGNTESRDYLKFLGEDFDHKQTPDYQLAKKTVKAFMKNIPICRYAALSRKLKTVDAERHTRTIDHLDDVLLELNDKKVLTYDPSRPAPSMVTSGNDTKRGKVSKHLFNGGRAKQRASNARLFPNREQFSKNFA